MKSITDPAIAIAAEHPNAAMGPKKPIATQTAAFDDAPTTQMLHNESMQTR
ncbi:hypothetical protein [Arthrobacter sp. 2MCAF14]|uniref:hypothetical protein n=1 Tax=Arthrobacter sp. 2MCAF14 TaxID=3232982 RepID=UPI003F8E8F90